MTERIKGSSQPFVSGLELWQWRQEAIAAAVAAEVSPDEVDWLLQEVANLDKLALRLESYKGRSHLQLQMSLEKLTQLWHRRVHEKLPVQYITGVTPWRNFSLVVNQSVLIPRPETEYLIDLAIAACRDRSSPNPLEGGHWADLGTGSGAIAIGLADSLTNTTIHAVEFSAEALAIAQHNAHRLGFADRINFYQGSWLEPLDPLQGQLSGIVSNPPYIPSEMVPDLQPEVAQHEPHLALDGGSDGLECIRHLVTTAPTYLKSGGVLLLEMMTGQAPTLINLLQQQGSYCQIKIFSDLAGIERFARAYKR